MKKRKVVLALLLGLSSFNGWGQLIGSYPDCNDYDKGILCPSNNIPVENWYEDSWNNIGIGNGGSDDYIDDVLIVNFYIRNDGGPIGCDEGIVSTNTTMSKSYTANVQNSNIPVQDLINSWLQHQIDQGLSGNETDVLHVRADYIIYSAFGWNEQDYSHKIKFDIINSSYIEPQLPDLLAYCPNETVNLNIFNPLANNINTDYTNIVWSVPGANTNNNQLNTSTLSQGIHNISLNVEIAGCLFNFDDFDEFTIHPTETIGWSSSPPQSMLNTDSPLGLNQYISSSASDVYFYGNGVLNSGNIFEFDPSITGVGLSQLSIACTSSEGCNFNGGNEYIETIANPGFNMNNPIDLVYAGFTNYTDEFPTAQYDYSTNPFSSSYNYNDYYQKYLQKGHGVCSEDTVYFKAAIPNPASTYTWYSDISGSLYEVGTGLYYTEYCPSTPINESREYNIYLAETNSIGLEGPKDPFKLIVTPKAYDYPTTAYTGLNEIINCIGGDTIVNIEANYANDYLRFDNNSPLNYSIYTGIGNTLAAFINYDWNNSISNVLLSTGYDYNLTWNGSKETTLILNKFNKNRPLFDTYYSEWYPYSILAFPPPPGYPWIPYSGPTNLHALTSCKCYGDSKEMIVVKNPEALFTSNVNGPLSILEEVRFIDESLFSGNNPIVEWEFNDGSFGHTGDTVWHFMTDYGVFDIQNVVTDEYGCSDTLVKTDWITVIDYTEVIENDELGSLDIYPIPTNGNLNIIGENIEAIIVFDLRGSEVLSLDYQAYINIDNLENGIYFVKAVLTNGKVLTKKIIKQ